MSKELTRRSFIKNSTLLMFSSIIGAEIPFGEKMPLGLIPDALANDKSFHLLDNKDGLLILNDFPLNAELPAHLLHNDITPAKHLFVRNNGVPPKSIDVKNWTLTVEGESAKRTVRLTLDELKTKFENVDYHLLLECGGNGRMEYVPSAKGNQWGTGAVGCPMWTGVRLRDVLDYVGVKEDAVYIGYYGKDTHLSGDKNRASISRGVPISKAMEPETLIAFAMNGEDIPFANGYPLRLICPGYPASTSGKWLEKLVIRNKVHDGEKMNGYAYRVPCKPTEPGVTPPPEEMCIIEEMPVKSLITSSPKGATHTLGTKYHVAGKAWSGSGHVGEVFLSIDYGVTWKKTKLYASRNKFAWHKWEHTFYFPTTGYYEIWVRAVDGHGRSQPMVLPGWNPKGYLNNASHRISVRVV